MVESAATARFPPRAGSDPSAAGRVAGRLGRRQRSCFVGRAVEVGRWRALLTEAAPAFHLVDVYGPGGVGKSTLLRAFADMSAGCGIPPVRIDGRVIEPTERSFAAAFTASLGRPGAPVVASIDDWPHRLVLTIDSCELLGPLDDWLRDAFLPELPETALILIAGRRRLSVQWRADSGWRDLIEDVPLGNLSAGESRAYLDARHVPREQFAAVFEFTQGHPLALSLAADVLAQDRQLVFSPEAVPDMIRSLVAQLIRGMPGADHRNALEACALVRTLDESLLAAMIDKPDVYDLFDWLRQLSIVDQDPEGLHLHDVARTALVADLRWRNPEWHESLRDRARAYYAARLPRARGADQQGLIADYLFLFRDRPSVRPFMTLGAGRHVDRLSVDWANPDDRQHIVEAVLRHEGPEAAAVAARWLGGQPASGLTIKDGRGRIRGGGVLLRLDGVDPGSVDWDPAFRGLAAFLAQNGGMRGGEAGTFARFWFGLDRYQGVSPEQTAIFVAFLQTYLATPGLAYSFVACSAPDFWLPFFLASGFTLVTGAEFELSGRRYGLFARDWRPMPPLTWFRLVAEGERLAALSAGGGRVPDGLDQRRFSGWVRDALRCLHSADRMQANPLVRSRIVSERAGDEQSIASRATALREIVMDALDALCASPRRAKLYEALYRAYVDPAPTQEAAAESLDLPLGTFRGHLRTATELVVQDLWRREIGIDGGTRR